MRFNYNLYPKAIQKIKEAGLEERVSKLRKSEELWYIGGYTYKEDVILAVKDLQEQGYYKNLPKDLENEYKNTLEGILKNPKDFNWTVNRIEGKIKEPTEIGDIRLFSGEIASLILNQQEIWDYKKFGFSSLTEFVSTISTYLVLESRGRAVGEGYKWTRKRKDGSEIVTEITGDTNADLRIFQIDITPYKTYDPFGNEINFRPEFDKDKNCVAAYHSTEGALLVAVLKYIEQQKIDVDFFSDKASELIKWGKSLGQGGGTCTEHFGGFDQSPGLFFGCYGKPIPKFYDSDESRHFRTYCLSSTGEGTFNTYIGSEGEFIISYYYKNSKDKQKINALFLPEDAEHIVKGLIYQSAKGLGRTSVKQLLSILEYKFSPQFEEDQKRFNP